MITFLKKRFKNANTRNLFRRTATLFLFAAFFFKTCAFASGLTEIEFQKTPRLAGKSILFVTHAQYPFEHHNTETLYQRGEVCDHKWEMVCGNSKIIKANFDAEGNASNYETLLESKDGVIRDIEISFDAKRILFSMRKNFDDSFKIYEMTLESKEIKQLTFLNDVSDIDPLYLPDGGIIFSSSRAAKYCGCNRHIMCNLYRMNSDGTNIVQIGNSIEFENTPSLMNDGRILYTRWEYVDRNFSGAQGLWTCNPDGTRHWLFWGQETKNPTISGVQMKSGKIAAIMSSCHDRPWGALVLINRNAGVEGEKCIEKIYPKYARKFIDKEGDKWGDSMKKIELKFQYPSPLDENSVLVSRTPESKAKDMALFIVDFSSDEEILVARITAGTNNEKRKYPLGIFDAKLLKPAAEIPNEIPAQIDYEKKSALVYVGNVYEGTHMKTVKPGEIKYLRIIENPSKINWSKGAWEGEGQQSPAMNYDDYDNKTDLGIVPVEEDGSAYFEVPSGKFVYLQALDRKKRMLQTMRSGFSAMPGEIVSCTGCHESREAAPPSTMKKSKALARGPSQILPGPLSGKPFSFVEVIQPILNKHCIECHDDETGPNNGITLTGDKGIAFNRAYADMHYKRVISAIGAGPDAVQEAKTWGARMSIVVRMLEDDHGDCYLTKQEIEAFALWIDLNAPYYHTDDCAYPDNPTGRSPLTENEIKTLFSLCDKMSPFHPTTKNAIHAKKYPREIISFDNPKASEILRDMNTKSKAYKEALSIIERGAERLKEKPRADMDGFVETEIYKQRKEKMQKLLDLETAARRAILKGEKMKDIDSLK